MLSISSNEVFNPSHKLVDPPMRILSKILIACFLPLASILTIAIFLIALSEKVIKANLSMGRKQWIIVLTECLTKSHLLNLLHSGSESLYVDASVIEPEISKQQTYR